jgi:hypothetical protein
MVKSNKLNCEFIPQNSESEREFDGSDLLKTKSVASGADLLSSIRQRKERQLDISILQSEDDEEEEEIRVSPLHT